MLPLLLLFAGSALAADNVNKQVAVEEPAVVPVPQQNTGYSTDNMYSSPQYEYPQFVYSANARNDGPSSAPENWGPGVEVAHGPWVTVPNTPYGYGGSEVDPYGFGGSVGFGFDTQSLITWGLGAVILLLLISTAIQVFRRILPSVKSIMDEAGEGRSLETMTSLAQFALEAMEKYEAMNE